MRIRDKRIVHLLSVIFFSVFLFGCSDDGDSPPEPTFTGLWNNVFSDCGIVCHSSNAGDFSNLGPDLSTKSNFYNNLYKKSVSTDYSDWIAVKGGNCNDIYFITPGNANASTLAAALIFSVSETLSEANQCTTSYTFHNDINQTISDDQMKNDLITWINNGAKDN